MNFGQWVLGAVAGALALGALGAQAAPIPRSPVDASASVHNVQFYYYYDEAPPPVYYAPPPHRYYDGPRPRPYYEPRPAYEPPRTYGRPMSPGYAVPTLPDRKGRQGQMVIYDKEEAKDYIKSYRQNQKEIYKEKQRAWNRANGFR